MFRDKKLCVKQKSFLGGWKFDLLLLGRIEVNVGDSQVRTNEAFHGRQERSG